MVIQSRLRDYLLAGAAAATLVPIGGALRIAAAVGQITSARAHENVSSAAPPCTITVLFATAGDSLGLRRSLESAQRALRELGGDHELLVLSSRPLPASWPEPDRAGGVVTSHYLRNASIAELRRQGALVARGEVVVMAADGTDLTSRLLERLIACFQAPSCFAAHISSREQGSPTTGLTRGDVRAGKIVLWKVPGNGTSLGPEPVLWVPLEGSAFDRRRFQELLKQPVRYSGADTMAVDLCLRAWRQGWQVVSCQSPGAPGSPSASPQGASPEGVSADVAERDSIVLNWRHLTGSRELLRRQLGLALGLASGAASGQLNLRPLRYALAALPGLLLALGRGGAPRISTTEALRLSSHPYHSSRGEDGSKDFQVAPTVAAPPMSGRGDGAPMRILLVFPQLPYPPTHGGAVRMWNVLRTLAKRHRVSVLSFVEPTQPLDEVEDGVQHVGALCDEVRVVVRRPLLHGSSQVDRTVHIEMFDCSEMREVLLDMVSSRQYDVVQFHKTEMGQYVIPEAASVQLLVEHVVFYLAYRRQFLKWGRSLPSRLSEYLRLRHHELGLCRRFDGVLTMGPVDAAFLRRRLPGHSGIFDGPNGVDTEFYQFSEAPSDSHDILFVGNFDHSPNVDGVRFFLNQVFPMVVAADPDARLIIVGPGDYNSLPEVASNPRVVATGRVEDTRPYLRQCAVFAAPILAGAGTRVKILEAMSAGIPVVSTTLGAEGIDVVSGEQLILADDPHSFSRGLLQLLADRERRQSMRASARSLVERQYSWDVVGDRLESIYAELLARKSSVPAR